MPDEGVFNKNHLNGKFLRKNVDETYDIVRFDSADYKDVCNECKTEELIEENIPKERVDQISATLQIFKLGE